MPRWWASSWRIVIRTSSARSSGSGKSSSRGSRNSRIRRRDRDPVAAPLVQRHALVQAVQGLVGPEAVLAQLVGRRLVGDDERDLVERAAERLRDAGDGAIDEPVEPLVAGRPGPDRDEPGAASALRHGARILAAMTAVPSPGPAPGSSRGPPTRRSAPGPGSGRRARGLPRRPPTTGRAAPLPRLGRAGRRPRAAGGVLLLPGLLQPAWSWAPVARRLARARPVGRRRPARARAVATRRWTATTSDTLAADAVAVAEGSGLLGERPVVLAGHGFGALGRGAPRRRGSGARCAGLVLVDGGWERVEATTERRRRRVPARPRRAAGGHALDGRLAARTGGRSTRRPGTPTRSGPPATRVVETAAGPRRPRGPAARRRGDRPDDVRRATRRAVLATVDAPVTALVALGTARRRRAPARSCGDAAAARASAGRSPIRVAGFPGAAPQPDALPAGRGHGGDPRAPDGARGTAAPPTGR